MPCTVLDVQPCEEVRRGNMSQKMNRRIVKVRKRRSADAGLSLRSKKFKMVYVELCRTADLGVVGKDDGIVTVRSHLGHLLKPGDDVLAYDMNNLVYNDADVESIMGKRGSEPNFPDYIIVPESITLSGETESKTGFGSFRRFEARPQSWLRGTMK